MDKVSIIITTLNRSMLLKTAIRSALLQTYPKTEIIVVDGSNDKGTSDVLDHFKNDIVVVKDTKRNGVGAARNLGIEVMTGDYVSFLDDDDCFHPRKIERQMEILNIKKNVDLVYCPVGKKVRNYLFYKPLTERKNCWIRLAPQNELIMTPLVRTECFSVCGKFDESLKYFEDRDIWYRMHKKFRFAFRNNPDYVFYSPNIPRLSSQMDKISQSLVLLYEKHKNDFENKQSYFSELHYELAFVYITFRNYKQFFYHIKKSIENGSKLIPAFLFGYAQIPLGKYNVSKNIGSQKIKIDDECKQVFA